MVTVRRCRQRTALIIMRAMMGMTGTAVSSACDSERVAQHLGQHPQLPQERLRDESALTQACRFRGILVISFVRALFIEGMALRFAQTRLFAICRYQPSRMRIPASLIAVKIAMTMHFFERLFRSVGGNTFNDKQAGTLYANPGRHSLVAAMLGSVAASP